MTKSTQLYRFWDARGKLLYVGISHRIESRVSEHRRTKPWDRVASITVEHFPTRPSAEQAEKQAIQRERPRWNIVHSAKEGPLPSAPSINPCECSSCGRHIGKTRTHFIYNNLVWCLRCSDEHLISGGMFASCAAARQILAGKDLPLEVR